MFYDHIRFRVHRRRSKLKMGGGGLDLSEIFTSKKRGKNHFRTSSKTIIGKGG